MIGLPSRVADMQYPEWIWHNGTIKPWAEATTHVMSPALHYGSSGFEGFRSYATPDGPAIFRLSDHNRRLFASPRIHDMVLGRASWWDRVGRYVLISGGA